MNTRILAALAVAGLLAVGFAVSHNQPTLTERVEQGSRTPIFMTTRARSACATARPCAGDSSEA